ncbi:MAG: hypothetical protein OXL37_03230 [Chloroflexota bacterium]|nr:hypothetical protein [Chloroflexota bacterium]MDE2961999.1 hypothetical protein [Chloroflexota bacterium]
MMESTLNRTRSVRGARRRRVDLGSCPHCGGDVRQVRDIYGDYRQCLQCSREIPSDPAPMVRSAPAAMPATPESDELLVA